MAEITKTRAKKARTTESFDDEPGETLLPDVNVSKASDAELVKTAAITWSNAALREAVVIRFAAMGKAAWPLIERALEIPPFPGSESTSAVVTAISILEAIASTDAVARLMTWSKSARCSVAAHSRAALKRLGKKPPARRVEGPSRAQLDTAGHAEVCPKSTKAQPRTARHEPRDRPSRRQGPRDRVPRAPRRPRHAARDPQRARRRRRDRAKTSRARVRPAR